MYTNCELIKFGLYAERAHRLAFDLALLASGLGQYGKGMAIIADETRNIGIKLHKLLISEDEASLSEIQDEILELKYLFVNGWLESLRLHESQLTPKKRISVIMDELINLVKDIECALGIKSALPMVTPKVTERNKILNKSELFFLFTIGGKPFCEAMQNVLEVFLYTPEECAKEPAMVNIRGYKLPLLDYYDKLSVAKNGAQTILRISTEYEKEPKEYALLIDGKPEIFCSYLGVSSQAVGVPKELVRECWDCEENMQMQFLNYDLT